MSLQETIAIKIAALPLAQQREVLEFVESKLQATVPHHSPQSPQSNFDSLAHRMNVTAEGGAENTSSPSPRVKSMFGLLEGTTVDITLEEIKELRLEMWKNFPREFPE